MAFYTPKKVQHCCELMFKIMFHFFGNTCFQISVIYALVKKLFPKLPFLALGHPDHNRNFNAFYSVTVGDTWTIIKYKGTYLIIVRQHANSFPQHLSAC